MKESEIAKNILLERSCDNCIYVTTGMSIRRCKKSGALDMFAFLPEEQVCSDWKYKESIFIK